MEFKREQIRILNGAVYNDFVCFQLVVGLCVCGLGVLVSAEEKKDSTTAPETNETEAGETGAETENNGAIEKRGIGHGYGLGYGHGKQTKRKYVMA